MNKKDLDMEKDAVMPEESGTESESLGMAGVTVPAGYNSQYAGQIQQAYQDISQRQPFSYDVNSDAMYEALKNQYISGGQMAMMDTMGQAATLTGGYGNSYAQGAGQQAYQQYLQGLNDQMPDLYQMALENYMAQGDQMLQNYSMLMDMDNMEYGRYMDNMDMIQAQVLEMLRAGHRPSQDMIAASGLSQEYIDAMYPEDAGGSGGPDLVESWRNWLARTGGDGGNDGGGGEEVTVSKDPSTIYLTAVQTAKNGNPTLGYQQLNQAKNEGYLTQAEYDSYMNMYNYGFGGRYQK